MTNATIIRTTRVTYSDLYNTHSFFVEPGTRCFIDPLIYKPTQNGQIVKRMIFDHNTVEELKTIEAILQNGKKVTIDYLVPQSQTAFFRTVVFDAP